MPLQYSGAVRDAQNDAVEATIGASAVLKIRSGAQPGNCAAADSGNVLATIQLPADWMANSSGGVKAKLGTWEDPSADATGIAAHFRIYKSDGTTCGMQGSVTASGGGGDMTVDNVNFAIGQAFSVTAFQHTRANA